MVVTRAEWERQKLRALKRRQRLPLRDFTPEPVREAEREPGFPDKDLPVYAKDADNDG